MQKFTLFALAFMAAMHTNAQGIQDLTYAGSTVAASNLWDTSSPNWIDDLEIPMSWQINANAIIKDGNFASDITLGSNIKATNIEINTSKEYSLVLPSGSTNAITATGTMTKTGTGTFNIGTNITIPKTVIKDGMLNQTMVSGNAFGKAIELDGGSVGFFAHKANDSSSILTYENIVTEDEGTSYPKSISVTDNGGSILFTRYVNFICPISGSGDLTIKCGGERNNLGKKDVPLGTDALKDFTGKLIFDVHENTVTIPGFYGPCLNSDLTYDAEADEQNKTLIDLGLIEPTADYTYKNVRMVLKKNTKLSTGEHLSAFKIGELNAEEGSIIGGHFKNSNKGCYTLLVGGLNTDASIGGIIATNDAALFPNIVPGNDGASYDNRFRFVKEGTGTYTFTGAIPQGIINKGCIQTLEVKEGSVVINVPIEETTAAITRSASDVLVIDAAGTATVTNARLAGNVVNSGTLNVGNVLVKDDLNGTTPTVTLNSGSKNNFTITSASNYSHINAAGTVDFNGQTLTVSIADGHAINNGDKFTIVSSETGLSGEYKVEFKNNPAGVELTAVTEGNALVITAKGSSTTGIANVDATQETVSYISTNGVESAVPVKGINIVKKVAANGTVKISKTIY